MEDDFLREDDFFRNMEKILNSNWCFYAGEEKKVEITDKVITSTDSNMIDIMSDFYCVESINNLNEKSNRFSQDKISLRKLSKQHSDILRMKLFCKIELKKCLKFIEKRKLSFGKYYIDLPVFLSVESMWRFLITESDDYYSLEKLIVFNKLFKMITDRYYIRKDFFTSEEIGEIDLLGYDLKDYIMRFPRYLSPSGVENLIQNSVRIFKEAFNAIDNEIENYQKNILHFINLASLNIFDSAFLIKDFAQVFSHEVEAREIEKYALKKLNCYASMKIGEDIYITVNGIEGKSVKGSNLQTLQHIFKQLVPNSKYVPIMDETKYYTRNNKILTYKQFRKANPKKDKNRMFTCCERKLMAKYSEVGVGKAELTVTKPPCEFCKRELDVVNKDGENIDVSYMGSDLIRKYDDFAEEILNQNKSSI